MADVSPAGGWRARYARLPAGLRASTIMLVPTAAIGLSFGLTADPVLGAAATIAMSCIVWAGTAQFAAAGALAAGSGAPLAIVTGLLANMRYVPMSFGIAPSIDRDAPPLRRVLYGMALADASFASSHRGGGRFDVDMILWAGPLQWVGWVSGTIAGVLCASLISDPDAFGINAIFPVFYVSLLLPELRRPDAGRGRVVALLAAIAALAATPFTPAGIPVLIGAAAALAGIRR